MSKNLLYYINKINVVIEKDEYGYYAYCPELSGCQTQGDSIDEVLINIKDAAELYLETLPKDEIMVIQRLLSKLWKVLTKRNKYNSIFVPPP